MRSNIQLLVLTLLLALLPSCTPSDPSAQATATAETIAAAGTATAETVAATQTAAAGVRIVATATALQRQLGAPILGPKDGELPLPDNNDNQISVYGDDALRPADFIVEATFANPYSADVNTWDYGFVFRSSQDDNDYRIVIASTQTWELVRAEDDGKKVNFTTVSSGSIDGLNTGQNQTNSVRLVAIGPEGALFVNDRFVAALDLSDHTEAGSLLVGSGMTGGRTRDGSSTRYSKFTIWEVER